MTNSLNVGQNQYAGLVPLESGTNQLVLVASDAAGNTSSNVYTIISSAEFSGAITNPVFGAFATVPSNTVSGYVSALYDAGLPTQTNVTTVTINGVAAVLGTNVDGNGNVSFWTTNAIPLGVPITGTVGGPGIPTDPPSIPPMMSQVYEVTYEESGSEVIGAGEGDDPFDLQWNPQSNCWITALARNLETVRETPTAGGAHTDVVVDFDLLSPSCLTTLNPDQINNWYSPYGSFGYSFDQTTPIARSFSLGIPSCVHGAGREADVVQVPGSYNPGTGQCTFQNISYNLRALSRQRNTGWLTFRAPRQYDANTTVISTFEGVSYALPEGGTLDLSQVQFRGQSPVSNDTQSVSYLLTVNGGQEYTINEDDFTWPAFSVPGDYAYSSQDSDPCAFVQSFSRAGNYLTDMHSLSWTDFHNALPQIIGPTNLYVYCNSSPSSGVFYVTNAVPATSVNWSATLGSDKVQISSPTENPTVISPTDANHASMGVNDVTIGATLTFQNSQTMTLSQTLTVRKPWAFGPPQKSFPSPNANYPVNLQVNYAVLDQLCTIFPPALIAGVTATETFPNGSPPSSTTGAGVIQPNGTAQDHIEVPLSDAGGNIQYVQVITADCASVTNNITTLGSDNDATIVQTGPCH